MTENPGSGVVFGAALLFLFSVAVAAVVVVPQFAQIFTAFEAPLPLQSRILLATYQWWGIAPVAVGVAWLLARDVPNRSLFASAVAFGLAVLLVLFGLWACYSPIFALGS